MLDYLIVGLGLAGVSFCEQLEKNGRIYKVISNTSQTSSLVAGGLYNPVILKRLTLAWNAKEQFNLVTPFYKSLEDRLKVKLDHKIPVLRKFFSVEEQNMWFEACDKKGLKGFLSPEIQRTNNAKINAPLGFGEVRQTGRIDTELLISAQRKYLLSKGWLIEETFDYSTLEIKPKWVSYNGIKARNIVFAEGFGLKQNPYFNYLPLTGTKGEYLIIKAPDLNVSHAIKSSIFLIPWGDDIYRIGATYQWNDHSNLTTENARQELVQKLDMLISCKYEIVNQLAGIRPTVVDRRPLVGRHPKYENVYVFNGFGSRGVMIAPHASQKLFAFVEKGESLNPEMDITRFVKKYFKN